MPHKGPHISIAPDYVVNRILRINIDDFAEWPESVRNLAIAIAEELFLVAYNPFIDAETVRQSVRESFEKESVSLAHYYATAIGEGITMFWSAYEAEADFRDKLIEALQRMLPAECVLTDPAALVESATDARDLRLELPLLVVELDIAPGWTGGLFWEGLLALFYALIWLGRWVGWYVEVSQLRQLLGLEPGQVLGLEPVLELGLGLPLQPHLKQPALRLTLPYRRP